MMLPIATVATSAARSGGRAMLEPPGQSWARRTAGLRREARILRRSALRPRFGPRRGAAGELVGGLALRVLDLLEDLAHPGLHQVALAGGGVAVATADPFGLPGIEIVVGGHVGIVHRRPAAVNRRAGVGNGRR